MSNGKSWFECEVDDAKSEHANVDLRMPMSFCRAVSRRRLFAARGPTPPRFHLAQHRGSRARIVVAVSRPESSPCPFCLLVKGLSPGRAGLEYKGARVGPRREARCARDRTRATSPPLPALCTVAPVELAHPARSDQRHAGKGSADRGGYR